MLKTLLKFSFAILLCTWMVKTGKLDFNLISQAFHSGYLWVLGLLLLSSRLLICALRIKTILETKANRSISYLKIFSFDAISNFFSIAFPVGDFVRFLYYKNLGIELSSGMLVALMMLDRVIGLMALMTLVNFISIMRFENIVNMSPQLLSLVGLNALIFISLCFFMLFFFSRWFPKKKIAAIITAVIPNSPKTQKTFIDMMEINLSFKTFFKCFLLSIINQIAVLGSFLLFIIPFLPEGASLSKIFMILPIGFIGSALPISPGGMGVGHILFDNLFKLVEIYNGASLYNLYFVGNIIVCLIGIVPYLLNRKEIAKSKAG